MGSGEGLAGEWGKRTRSRTAESFQEERKMVLICHRQKQKGRLHNIFNDSASVTHPDSSNYVYYADLVAKVLSC